MPRESHPIRSSGGLLIGCSCPDGADRCGRVGLHRSGGTVDPAASGALGRPTSCSNPGSSSALHRGLRAPVVVALDNRHRRTDHLADAARGTQQEGGVLVPPLLLGDRGQLLEDTRGAPAIAQVRCSARLSSSRCTARSERPATSCDDAELVQRPRHTFAVPEPLGQRQAFVQQHPPALDQVTAVLSDRPEADQRPGETFAVAQRTEAVPRPIAVRGPRRQVAAQPGDEAEVVVRPGDTRPVADVLS